MDLADRGEQDAAAELLRGVSEHAGRPGIKPAFPGGRAAAADRPRFPGALPAVFTVPFAPNPWFTGRAEALAAIRGRLAGTGPGRVVPVTGIGGVGKTQLAVEYTYAERNRYDVIWWVRAQPLAMARADLAALVADPRLPDPPQLPVQAGVEDRLAAARDWLERHDWCLLVVDNVDDPAAVRPLLPRAGGGHVLLTAGPMWTGPIGPRRCRWTCSSRVTRRGSCATVAAIRTRRLLPRWLLSSAGYRWPWSRPPATSPRPAASPWLATWPCSAPAVANCSAGVAQRAATTPSIPRGHCRWTG